jgi:hypothetical protein
MVPNALAIFLWLLCNGSSKTAPFARLNGTCVFKMQAFEATSGIS